MTEAKSSRAKTRARGPRRTDPARRRHQHQGHHRPQFSAAAMPPYRPPRPRRQADERSRVVVTDGVVIAGQSRSGWSGSDRELFS